MATASLMRVLPLALWHRGDDAQVARDARLQSLVTHGHIRSQLCCALYCLCARRIWRQARDPWNEAVDALRRIVSEESSAIHELETRILGVGDERARGTGYVVDCLHSARMAMQRPTYEEVVRQAVRLGSDTDTTACVAGGLAGLRDGYAAIPQRWRDALREIAVAEDLVARLIEWAD